MMTKDGAIIVQSDFHVLLDERHPEADTARQQLSRFSELIKRPGDLHTYRITPLSIWNAAASGMSADQMIDCLCAHSRYELEEHLLTELEELANRYGKLQLIQDDNTKKLLLVTDDEEMAALLKGHPMLVSLEQETYRGITRFTIPRTMRGSLKQELVRDGLPIIDLAGYHAGESLNIELKSAALDAPHGLREYQSQAVDAFHQEGTVLGGSGILVLPCGSGKTIIGMAALARLRCAALILTSNVTSVKQWKAELLEKTSLTNSDVGEYAGDVREVKPITITTYQMMTHRTSKEDAFKHLRLFEQRDWGLIIYDEVHLLPAPVFRMTADIQAKRRLGLTATLVREDGRERDVFSLIGPKRFDLGWKKLEAEGYIAKAHCTEIRLPLAALQAEHYRETEDKRVRNRIAAENPMKLKVVRELLERHKDMQVLVIGQYIEQLKQIGSAVGAPVLTGSTPHDEREMLFQRFRSRELPVLVVSKVANFAINLPDASVAIQVSGSFGSRQEEAQRIGRILRPKEKNEAWFYTLVTDETKETEFALKRQLFLTEQGYAYQLVYASIPEAQLLHKEG